jgi:hypothetical protein
MAQILVDRRADGHPDHLFQRDRVKPVAIDRGKINHTRNLMGATAVEVGYSLQRRA